MYYKSCRLLEHGIYIYLDPGTGQLCAGHCCNTDNFDFKERLYIYPDLKKEKLDWEEVFSVKRALREEAKAGIYPIQCEGCFELHYEDWDEEDYINHFTAAHIMKCNSRCIYCPIGRIAEWHNREQDFDIKVLLEELREKGLLRFNGSLRFVGGEPTLMNEFEWLVDLFSEKNVPEIYVPTSGIKISKSLCKALEKVETASIVISVDSGCKETFERIKGTKFYEIVMKNIKKYLSHAKKKEFIILKFILLAGYNDTSSEIDKWLRECKRIGIKSVQFDAEHSVSSSSDCENKKYINRTIKMLRYAELAAKRYGIELVSELAFMNRAKSIYEESKNGDNSGKKVYTDAELKEEGHLKSEKYYGDIKFNIDRDYNRIGEIEEAVQREHFRCERIAFLTSEYKEITKSPKFEESVFALLRLGFDVNYTTSRYDRVTSEVLKTSYSRIKLKGIHIKPLLERKYYLGSIERS